MLGDKIKLYRENKKLEINRRKKSKIWMWFLYYRSILLFW